MYPFLLKYVFPVLLLAACVVLFSKAVRLYHRTGFLMGLSHGSSEHSEPAEKSAVEELERASLLYRHGWRLFYAAIATGAWLISGWVSLVVTLALLIVDIAARAEWSALAPSEDRFHRVHDAVHARRERVVGRGGREVHSRGLHELVGIVRAA